MPYNYKKKFSKSIDGRNIWRNTDDKWYYSDTGNEVPQRNLGPLLQDKKEEK